MAQDPWKRAHQLKQRQAPPATPAGLPPAVLHPGGRRWIAALVVVILVLGAGAAAFHFFRHPGNPLAPIKQLEESRPVQKLEKKLTGKKVQVDQAFLFGGLGIGLALFETYEPMLEQTKPWKPGWEVKDTGGGTVRLQAPGIKAFAVGGLIETYDIDLGAVTSAPCWKPWLPKLAKAGLTQSLAWTDISGEELAPASDREFSYTDPQAVKLPDGWAHRMVVLHFISGKLKRIEGRLSFGPANEPGGKSAN